MLRTFRIATLSAALTVTAAACKTDKPAQSKPAASAEASKPAAKPSAVPELAAGKATSNSELETKGIAMMQRLADVFAADAKDCDKLAADIKAFVAENKPLLAQLAAMDQQQSDEQREAFTARNAEAQAAVAAKMQGAMTACASNPSVLAAMKDFPGDDR